MAGESIVSILYELNGNIMCLQVTISRVSITLRNTQLKKKKSNGNTTGFQKNSPISNFSVLIRRKYASIIFVITDVSI